MMNKHENAKYGLHNPSNFLFIYCPKSCQVRIYLKKEKYGFIYIIIREITLSNKDKAILFTKKQNFHAAFNQHTTSNK